MRKRFLLFVFPTFLSISVNKRSVFPSPGNLDTDSFPLHLNVKSPNSQLRGVVPHFEEYGELISFVFRVSQIKALIVPAPGLFGLRSCYHTIFNHTKINLNTLSIPGETVESVMKAQKRFKIPRPDEYSSEIVKKNDIPRPDDDDSDVAMTTFKHKKRSNVFHKKKADESAKKRQYVNYPQMQQQQQYAYNNPYASNSLSSGDIYAQQNAGMLQYQQPQPAVQQQMVAQQVASHVQNLDGAIARPIVTGESP